jgi:glycosyltransferase involved in cell wall biosynthesis
VEAILEQIRRAPSVLDVFSLTDELVAAAAGLDEAGDSVDAARRVLVGATHELTDAPTAIAAAHALARLPGSAADDPLEELLGAGGWLAPHVAWSLADRRPTESLVRPLIGLVDEGRLGGMLAQRTLVRWADDRPDMVVRTLAQSRLVGRSPAGSGRLVETFGLIGGDVERLIRIAADRDEPAEARIAAIAALGDRPGSHARVLDTLAAGDDMAADDARLALFDHRSQGAGGAGRPVNELRIAQVHLGGRLDESLAHAGEGDTGGIATLLVQLGGSLAADPRIAAVTTIGRGTATEAVAAGATAESTHSVLSAPLGRHEDASFAGPWPALVAAERGLRRILRHRPASLLHLRMADVGSLAAARIARRQGLPIVFTLAPDPHAVIVEMERSGELDRASFGPTDARAALWFRARLVRHLADSARQVVLFPRPELVARLRDLVGIDVSVDPGRYHVVPEGIDTGPVQEARRAMAGIAVSPPPIVADLRTAIEALGAHRRGRQLVVSVGRLSDVKGMARMVEAFAADPGLRRRANLVIVGGNLADPTPEERAEIERIEAALAAAPELADAVVLLGHRPHDDVLRILAVAESGDGSWVAPGGAYACGSRKEEFGLAIVEALAVGLPVVAPRLGGPASYVEEGLTGLLVDTMDRAALAAGIHGALDIAGNPGRAKRARYVVATRFTIRAMADALIPIYGAAQAARTPVPA